MKKPIGFLTQECCESLLAFTSNPELRTKYNQESYDISGLSFLSVPSKFSIDDSLQLGPLPKDDSQSCIDLYKELESLDSVQANDKRLWVSLNHAQFFEYTKARWHVDKNTTDAKIIDRFHFEGAGVDSRMGNSLSRLWWTAKVTVDKTRRDEFELTRLIWERQDIHLSLMERSFSTYPNVVQGFLEFYGRNRKLKEDDLRTILKGLNAIGGVKVLPLLSKQEVTGEIQRIVDFGKVSIS